MLSIRTACDDNRTQLECDDDSGSGRSSRIDIFLDPGDYFVLMDIYRFNPPGGDNFECGDLTLDVEML